MKKKTKTKESSSSKEIRESERRGERREWRERGREREREEKVQYKKAMLIIALIFTRALASKTTDFHRLLFGTTRHLKSQYVRNSNASESSDFHFEWLLIRGK